VGGDRSQIPNLPRVVISGRHIAKKAAMHALSKIVEIGSRSGSGVATWQVSMRTSAQRNDTSGGDASVDEIAAGPVGLLGTVVGQWLLLGQ
jgi:hypothetical protein